jgi:phospholipid-transporting ATPase
MIGDLSPTSKFGTLLPLSVIAALTAGKEFVEDRKRHLQDRAVNARLSKVLVGGKFELVEWKDIKATWHIH